LKLFFLPWGEWYNRKRRKLIRRNRGVYTRLPGATGAGFWLFRIMVEKKVFLDSGKIVKNQEISGDLFEWQMQSSLNMREHGRDLLPGSTSMGGRVYRSWIPGKTCKGSISLILHRT
jgi:hypothetical protein